MAGRSELILCVAGFLLLSGLASGQKVRYPAALREGFAAADATITPHDFSRPLICVSTAKQAGKVEEAGGIPVMLPLDGESYAVAREAMASIDGYILTGKEGALRIKAICEQNVPTLGSSALLDSMSKALWHNPRSVDDIEQLVEKARTFRHARQIMERTVTLDSHCDLPMMFSKGYAVDRRDCLSQMSIQKMREGRLSAVVLAAYIPKGPITDSAFVSLREKCIGMIDEVHSQVERNGEYCVLATSSEEAREARRDGKVAFILAIENASPIGYDLGMIPYLRSRGVRCMTLCHNGSNQICHTSYHAMGSMEGLTTFGFRVVEEMNRNGMVIDLSHTSDGTVFDVCRTTRAPVVCTHSTCRALYAHHRSLSDDELRAIAATGGVVQITLLKSFMAPRKSPVRIGVDDMIRHIDHVVSTVGIDHVGVGMDMCGGGGEWDYYSSSDAVWLTVRLLEKGYSDSDIRKIWGDNFLRVLDENMACSQRMEATGK